MDTATRQMVQGWLAMHGGDVEAVAVYMARTLRIGRLPACRTLVLEAKAV